MNALRSVRSTVTRGLERAEVRFRNLHRGRITVCRRSTAQQCDPSEVLFMDRVTRWLVAGAALAAVAAPMAAHAKGASYLRAERAGWMMGMYVGEKKDQPFPFIIQVDKAGDAYRK